MPQTKQYTFDPTKLRKAVRDSVPLKTDTNEVVALLHIIPQVVHDALVELYGLHHDPQGNLWLGDKMLMAAEESASTLSTLKKQKVYKLPQND